MSLWAQLQNNLICSMLSISQLKFLLFIGIYCMVYLVANINLRNMYDLYEMGQFSQLHRCIKQALIASHTWCLKIASWEPLTLMWCFINSCWGILFSPCPAVRRSGSLWRREQERKKRENTTVYLELQRIWSLAQGHFSNPDPCRRHGSSGSMMVSQTMKHLAANKLIRNKPLISIHALINVCLAVWLSFRYIHHY